MKTEQEIRRHRDNLILLNLQPCSCAATEHAAECQEAMRMIAMEALALTWALGEKDEYDKLVAALESSVCNFIHRG